MQPTSPLNEGACLTSSQHLTCVSQPAQRRTAQQPGVTCCLRPAMQGDAQRQALLGAAFWGPADAEAGRADPVAASRSAQAALEAALEREPSAAAQAAAEAARLRADAAIAALHAERQQQVLRQCQLASMLLVLVQGTHYVCVILGTCAAWLQHVWVSGTKQNLRYVE